MGDRREAFILPRTAGQHRRKAVGRERAHREHQSAACAVRFFEQGRDDDDGGAGRASGSDAQLMLGGGHQQFPEPAPVRPELVEGPLFSFGRRKEEERSFDKLRTNGKWRRSIASIGNRSEEHTSELQSLMRNSYA